MPDGSEFQTAGAATLKPGKAKYLGVQLFSTLESTAPSAVAGGCCFVELSTMQLSRATSCKLDDSTALSITGRMSRQKCSRSSVIRCIFSASSAPQVFSL